VCVLGCETLTIRSEETYNSTPANILKLSTEIRSVGVPIIMTFRKMTFFVSHYRDTITRVPRVISYESREMFSSRDNRKKK